MSKNPPGLSTALTAQAVKSFLWL